MPVQKSRFKQFPYTTGNSNIDNQILALVSEFKDEFDRTLLAEMMTSVYRLGSEAADTGDLKILNSALKELRYAFKVFRPYRSVRKVTVFGSARVSAKHPSYRMAKEFGRLMARSGWMVITGAASGIMKAGHEGAGRQASFGINIRLPFEQESNPVIASDNKLITCKYFFTRKLLFIKESHATVLFPGGFGTLDEGFESLTLVQTGKSELRPIIFVETPGEGFWKPLLTFFKTRLEKEDMISSSEQALYDVAYTPEEAARKVCDFYSVYHSQRYVGEWLLLRINKALSEPVLERIGMEFSDLMVPGSLHQRGPLPEEMDEAKISSLVRLAFKFDRKSHGRLMAMIQRINELGKVRK